MTNPFYTMRMNIHILDVTIELESQGYKWIEDTFKDWPCRYIGISIDGFHTSCVGTRLIKTCIIDPERYDGAVKELFRSLPYKTATEISDIERDDN